MIPESLAAATAAARAMADDMAKLEEELVELEAKIAEVEKSVSDFLAHVAETEEGRAR